MKNIVKRLTVIFMFLSIVACSEKPIKEYSSPEKPILLSPLKNDTSKEGAPVLNWTAIK